MKVEAIVFGILFWSIILYYFYKNRNKNTSNCVQSNSRISINTNLIEKLNSFHNNYLHEYLYTECYPYVIFPIKLISEEILQPSLLDESEQIKKGSSESMFFERLKNSPLGDRISNNKYKVGNFYPDFTYIDIINSVHIDIEIDEPFSYNDNMPIHYIDFNNLRYFDKNGTRDKILSEQGWTTIRFSEEQIINDTESCINLISNVVNFLTFPIDDNKFKTVKLKVTPRWSEKEAFNMSHRNNREFYASSSKIVLNVNKIKKINNIIQYKDNDYVDLNFKGSIKRIIANSKNITTDKGFKKVIKDFDSSGRLINTTEYSQVLESPKSTLYVHSNFKQIINESNGEKVIHFYDFEGICYKSNYYDKNGVITEFHIHKNEPTQRCIKSNKFDVKRELISTAINYYDDNYLLVSRRIQSAHQKLSSNVSKHPLTIIEFSYDKKENIISKKYNLENLFVTNSYEYKEIDKFDNPIYYFIKRNETVFEYQYEIEYY